MPVKRPVLKLRAQAKTPQGKYLSLLRGRETDDDLKELILALAENCPRDVACPQCPFRILGALAKGPRLALVNSMSREMCLKVFESERNCRADMPGGTCGK